MSATAVPGENFQKARVHGEYLLRRPTCSLVLSGLECVSALLAPADRLQLSHLLVLTLTLVAAGSAALDVLGAVLNLIVCLLLCVAFITALLARWYVSEEVNEEGHRRYFVTRRERRLVSQSRKRVQVGGLT